MIRFQTVLALCLASVLSLVMTAVPSDAAVTPDESYSLSMEKQKKVAGQVLSLMTETVARIVAANLNETTGSDSLPTKGIPYTHPFNNPTTVQMPDTEGGVAKIHRFGTGVICSGVHLRPWLILTTWDCLVGRDAKNLYATVILLDSASDTQKSILVQVESATMDPAYEEGKMTHNFAILQIYGRLDWDVGEFVPPQTNFTTAELIEKNIDTLVESWKTEDNKTCTLASTCRKATEDLQMCGEPGPGAINSFCVPESESGREVYTDVDIGTPFYYKSKNLKRCLGIYMGKNVNQPMKGHIFQPLYPSIDWIEEFIQEHPIPPMPI